MATDPYPPQAPVLGQKILDSTAGTTDQTIFTAGTFGASLASLTIFSGPTTPPGERTCYVKAAEGSTVGTFHVFRLTDSPNTLQASIPLFDLEGGASIKIAVDPALPTGATLHCTITGRTYEPATEEEGEE